MFNRRKFFAVVSSAAFAFHTKALRKSREIRVVHAKFRMDYGKTQHETDLIEFTSLDAAADGLGEAEALRMLNNSYKIRQLAQIRRKMRREHSS